MGVRGSVSDPVIVALIGLLGSCIGSIIGVLASSKLTQYRIEQLEKKVDKHNNIIERTFQLEKDVELISVRLEGAEQLLNEKVKVANHRLGDLEEFHKSG